MSLVLEVNVKHLSQDSRLPHTKKRKKCFGAEVVAVLRGDLRRLPATSE
jgi:hypothetical protein